MTTARTLARYRDLLRRLSRVKIAVAGDLIADEYIYCQVDRVSR